MQNLDPELLPHQNFHAHPCALKNMPKSAVCLHQHSFGWSGRNTGSLSRRLLRHSWIWTPRGIGYMLLVQYNIKKFLMNFSNLHIYFFKNKFWCVFEGKNNTNFFFFLTLWIQWGVTHPLPRRMSYRTSSNFIWKLLNDARLNEYLYRYHKCM